MQHPVSSSLASCSSTSFKMDSSLLMHGENFAPRWMRSAARGPSQKLAGSLK